MLQALDAGDVRRWAAACVQSLDLHRETIDRINVYPVPDSDTGSNLLATLRAALDGLLRAPADECSGAGPVLSVLARGAVAGACGNSGVIVSQLLRGLAESLGAAERVTGAELRAALARGAELATAAVAEPVEGTMLSVLTAAADAVRAARPAAGSIDDGDSDGANDGDDRSELAEVSEAAARAAAEALARTPSQLEVLARAGVVDAGGRGVVVLLDALLAIVSEQPAALVAAQRAHAETEPPPASPEPDHSLITPREAGSDEYGYEVMYLLDLPEGGSADRDGDRAGSSPDGSPGSSGNGSVRVADDAIDRLRDTLIGLGDCVSVVGDGSGRWTVHVHCNDIGAAIEAGVRVGRPSRIRVARFADARPDEASRYRTDRAVVVVVRSAELAELLAAEGVVSLLVSDADEQAPYRLLEAITGTAAAHVSVLPADAGLMEVADEAAIRAVAAGQDVVVVPCASAVQVLAAVAVHDPRRRAGDDVVSMAEAAAATRRGAVTVAGQDAITWVGQCRAGDVLGFADDEVVLIEPGPASILTIDRAARGVVERMLTAGGELITALLGADAPDELTSELRDFLHTEHPETELVVYRGGQTDAVLVLGVE